MAPGRLNSSTAWEQRGGAAECLRDIRRGRSCFVSECCGGFSHKQLAVADPSNSEQHILAVEHADGCDNANGGVHASHCKDGSHQGPGVISGDDFLAH